MSQDVECFGVYRDERLLFAFARGEGPILGPISDAPPLYEHPALRGRLMIAGLSDPIADLVRGAPSVERAIEALRAAGYRVLPAPRDAIRWALGGLI
jgi:hypothetical protein